MCSIRERERKTERDGEMLNVKLKTINELVEQSQIN